MKKLLFILTLGVLCLTACQKEEELSNSEKIAQLEKEGNVVLQIEAVDGGLDDFFRYKVLDGNKNKIHYDIIEVGKTQIVGIPYIPEGTAVVEIAAINQGSRGALYVKDRNGNTLGVLIARGDFLEINLDELLSGVINLPADFLEVPEIVVEQ
jgi:hypothetical protein